MDQGFQAKAGKPWPSLCKGLPRLRKRLASLAEKARLLLVPCWLSLAVCSLSLLFAVACCRLLPLLPAACLLLPAAAAACCLSPACCSVMLLAPCFPCCLSGCGVWSKASAPRRFCQATARRKEKSIGAAASANMFTQSISKLVPRVSGVAVDVVPGRRRRVCEQLRERAGLGGGGRLNRVGGE